MAFPFGQDTDAEDQDGDGGDDPADALAARPLPLAGAEAVEVADDDGERHERGIAHGDAQSAEPGKAEVEQVDGAVVQQGHQQGDEQDQPVPGPAKFFQVLFLVSWKTQ